MQSASRSASPQHGDINHVKLTCYACHATFDDHNALRNHKMREMEWENLTEPYLTHIYCPHCDRDFMTWPAGNQHLKQFHAEKQDINCPGCNQHFVHFSAFVRHVEFHECPVISQENAAARCQKELDFARALERIDRMGRGVNRPKDFTVYLGGDRGSPPENHLPVRLATANGASTSWPSDIQLPDQSDFPRLPNRQYYHGDSNVPDFLTGEGNNPLHGQEGENPWASARDLFPSAPAAQRPTSHQTRQLQLLNHNRGEWQREERAMIRARGLVQMDPDDPGRRTFDHQRLFCPYTKKYKCPRCKRGKGFKSWPALKQHMQSGAHAYAKTVTCPCCMDTFKHLFALAAHVESADKKCALQHSDIFEIFLGQLTWNLIEVTGEHKTDGTTKFAISKRAEKDYGVAKPAQLQLTFGHHQVHGSEPASDRPQLTSSALSQLENQIDQSLPSFKTRQHSEAQWRPKLQQRQQPSQYQTPVPQVQTQTQFQPQRSQAEYQQQFPSLPQRQQPRSSQIRAKTQTQDQPRESHAQYQQQQSQQPPQVQAQFQSQPQRGQSHAQGQEFQFQWLQASQQPTRGLGSGLTELALAQVPAFPPERCDDEKAWSGDGDGDGDAGW